MKRLFTLLLLATMLISCSSDDEIKEHNLFNGTKWEYTNIDPKDDSYLTYTLTFSSNTECGLNIKGYVGMEVSINEYYIYNVINDTQLVLSPKTIGNIIYNATVDQNKITLINSSTNKVYIILHKI